MTMKDIVDEIKLELTGNVLETELDDSQIQSVIKKCLRKIERYWDETKLVTVPWASCIDLKDFNSSSIVKVYRTQSAGDYNTNQAMSDPMFAQQWMLFSNGGTMYNLNDYVLNYASWTTMSQIKNTISTDLAFREDKQGNKLYINNYISSPTKITIEFVPKLKNVKDIKSDYWIDILIQMSTAMTKIILGRIRTRFTQSNALWAQDGEKLLEEGNTKLKEIEDRLNENDNLVYGID